MTIAALYVAQGGCYFGLDGVDPWDEVRDARLYAGPWPVVAHPPCARWGRYATGGPSAHGRFEIGDDGGCFAAAVASVRRFGGVIEHPAGSYAWARHNITSPPQSGGWIPASLFGDDWTCCVEQGGYGHRARKATWLYVCGVHPRDLPSLRWGRAEGDFVRLDEGFHSTEERKRAVKTGACQLLSHKQRAATPPEFRDVLLAIARSATGAP